MSADPTPGEVWETPTGSRVEIVTVRLRHSGLVDSVAVKAVTGGVQMIAYRGEFTRWARVTL